MSGAVPQLQTRRPLVSNSGNSQHCLHSFTAAPALSIPFALALQAPEPGPRCIIALVHRVLWRPFSARMRSCSILTPFLALQDAEKAAEKLHDALIINGVRCKLLWGKPQAQTGQQQHMQPYPGGAGGPPGGPGGQPGDAPFGQPMYGPDGTPLPPPRLFGAQPAQYPSMDPSMMGAVPRGPAPGAGQAAAPDGAATPPMHMQQPPHMHGMMPPAGFPPGMGPQGHMGMPMGAMPPPGMPMRPMSRPPHMHAPPAGMGLPLPGSIVPPGAMPPVHPGAQTGFGMVARPRMGAGAGGSGGPDSAAARGPPGGGPSGVGAAPTGAAVPQDAPPGPEVQGAAA